MKKRITSIVLSVCLCLTLLPTAALAADLPADAPTFSGGSGMESDPYLLSSKEDIVAVQEYLNSLDDDTASALDCADSCGLGCYHGYYFKLTKDIDMTGVTDWTPFNFCGTLDGAGHTISNLHMTEKSFDDDDRTSHYAAFFGQLVHAQIKNIHFKNCTATISSNVQHPDPNQTYRDIYASIVAYASIASSFENVSVVDCTVSQNGKPTNIGYAAGLIAYAEISNISGCSVQGGNINVNNNYNINYTGGLVGAVSDMYYEYITDYNNPFNMQVGAGKDFGIYNSFSTATILVQNATNLATGGLIGMVECCYLDFTCKNCMVGGTITANNNAAGIIGSCDTYIDEATTNLQDCVVYSTQIQGKNYADYLYRPFGGYKDNYPVTITNCKVSDATSVSVTDTESGSVTNYGEITTTALSETDCQVNGFKSNLHGKLTDGTANVTITLSQGGSEKYTAVTDADGEYNFGKQVLMGDDYTLNIAESSSHEAYTTSVTIGYAANEKKDITRKAKAISVTGVTLDKSELSMTVGGTATLTATVAPTDATNQVVTWTSTPAGVVTVDENGVVTAIAAGTATITATAADGGFTATCTVTVSNPSGSDSGSGSSSGPTKYTITLDSGKNGSVTTDRKRASKGTTVTITVTPDAGYTLETLTVLDKNGNAIELTDLGDGKYSFKMPAGKVTVNAAFTEENTVLDLFTDVTADKYYYDGVLWAAKNGITGGVGNDRFAPDETCTKAQIVTFLWRAAGSPEPKAASGFVDVPGNAYYAQAVAWAVENDITGGVGNDQFAPEQTCTRAQAVAFLYRYAASQNMDAVTLQELVSGYADAAEVPGYALSAFNWALAGDIVNGNGGKLMPNEDCTRAQIVTMLYRLLGE